MIYLSCIHTQTNKCLYKYKDNNTQVHKAHTQWHKSVCTDIHIRFAGRVLIFTHKHKYVYAYMYNRQVKSCYLRLEHTRKQDIKFCH